MDHRVCAASGQERLSRVHGHTLDALVIFEVVHFFEREKRFSFFFTCWGINIAQIPNLNATIVATCDQSESISRNLHTSDGICVPSLNHPDLATNLRPSTLSAVERLIRVVEESDGSTFMSNTNQRTLWVSLNSIDLLGRKFGVRCVTFALTEAIEEGKYARVVANYEFILLRVEPRARSG